MPDKKKILYSGLLLLIGLTLYSLPRPPELTIQAWRLLAIFIPTIVGLILQPWPMGAVVLLGIVMSILTGALTLPQALSGFSHSTVWLIVMAFLFGRGLSQSGLGKRIAYWLIRSFGKSTLGLSYSLACADLVLSPAMPSNTARGGGILYPITMNLARAFDSEPGARSRKIGAFLMVTGYQIDMLTSALFTTAMAANLLAIEMAQKLTHLQLNWGDWALAASFPGVLCLLIIPYFLYIVFPPQIKQTPQAVELASSQLRAMGSMTYSEKITLSVFALLLTLWASSQWHGLDATVVAYIGLAILILFNVVTWKDVLSEQGAWDALIWFGGLVALAGGLNDLGVIPYFVAQIGQYLQGFTGIMALIALLVIYFYSHYLFASLTAHVAAMYPAFLGLAIANGAPPLLSALTLGFFSNICAATTHYGSGPAPIFFGAGFVSQATWWKLGFAVSLIHILIWIGVGLLWWKFLGYW